LKKSLKNAGGVKSFWLERRCSFKLLLIFNNWRLRALDVLEFLQMYAKKVNTFYAQ
jgi:hypothetical protein